jgi:magnesium and cobalt exporter, CNNM family
MSAFIFAILLIIIACLALTLKKTYFYLPSKELRRQASRGDNFAKTLLQAEMYGGELKVVLWLVAGLAAAGSFLLFARIVPTLLGFIVVVASLGLVFIWIPRTKSSQLGRHLAQWCTPGVVWIMHWLHPVTAVVAYYIGRFPADGHTGLYEREDVYDLLRRQKDQTDNRISSKDLELLRKTLRFGDYHVRDLLVPKRHVKAVNINDSIGPVLLDELHKIGHARFPVYDGQPANLVGTFSADDVPDVTARGRVRDYFEARVAFVHENDGLEQALQALHQTHQHILVVVNSSNEYVGIVALSDILHELLGKASEDSQFTEHTDRKAVAARYTETEPVETEASETIPAESSEMVE